MANKQTGSLSHRQSNDDDDSINFRQILIRYLSNWPLFVSCILIALAGAYVYIKLVRPVYQVNASLVIQDTNDKPAQNDDKANIIFQKLDIANAPKVVENEIQVLKSNQLIQKVVDHFQLTVNYTLTENFLNNQDLYGESPVNFKLYSESAANYGHPQKLNIKILDTSTYLLMGKGDVAKKYHFGDTVTDNMGKWTIAHFHYLVPYIDKKMQITVTDTAATVLNYQNLLTVEINEKPSSVVEITINDQNVKRGEDFINYLIFCYKQREIDEKNKVTKSTLAFIDTRLASLAGELSGAESRVEGFRTGKGLTDINAQSQIYLQQVQSNDQKLNDLDLQLNVVKGLEKYLSQPDNADSNIPSTSGITDVRLIAQVQKLSDLELERNKLLATLPPRNPAFDPINEQIATVKTAIRDNVKNLKSSLLATQQSIQSFKTTSQASIQNVPGQERELEGLTRDQATKQTLYNYLLQKREEISVTYSSSLSNVSLVDQAYAVPVKTSKKIIPFGIAFLIGLIFPAGLIYAKDTIKNAISSRKEIESATSVPVLAELSYVKLPSVLVIDNLNNKDSFMLVEQFRHLRTQLNFLNQSIEKGKITLITSSTSSEGKSFISNNLAVSLARSDKKTILLEMDIYKPSKVFVVPGEVPGISEYLSGKAGRTKIIQKPAAYPGLHVIGCGIYNDDFSEMLDKPSFQTLLEELRKSYDHILIDTPPIHEINDAYIISAYCDATLYVVRNNYTSKTLLPFIQKLYTDQKLPNMNIVFNGLTGGRDSDGYKYKNYYQKKVPV